MGHLKLRKMLKAETNWIDKNTKKHKHDYGEHYILEQINPSGGVKYYNIMKCKYCMSFKSIPESGNISGCIFDKLTEEQNNLPKLVGNKKNEYIIGFNDLDKVSYK